MRKTFGRKLRKLRIRAKISGTIDIPRLSVFRSNLHLYGSLVDEISGKILVSVGDRELKKSSKKTKVEKAYEVGVLISEKAKKKKIHKIVFDRAGYKYHGRVKALAEGAWSGGLKL